MSVNSDDPDYLAELYLLQLEREKLNTWEKIKLAIYDADRGEIFGKDSRRWGKLL